MWIIFLWRVGWASLTSGGLVWNVTTMSWWWTSLDQALRTSLTSAPGDLPWRPSLCWQTRWLGGWNMCTTRISSTATSNQTTSWWGLAGTATSCSWSTLGWQRSSGTTGRGSTLRTEKTRTWRELQGYLLFWWQLLTSCSWQHSQVCLHQRTFGYWAIKEGWHGEFGLCPHVF